MNKEEAREKRQDDASLHCPHPTGGEGKDQEKPQRYCHGEALDKDKDDLCSTWASLSWREEKREKEGRDVFIGHLRSIPRERWRVQ